MSSMRVKPSDLRMLRMDAPWRGTRIECNVCKGDTLTSRRCNPVKMLGLLYPEHGPAVNSKTIFVSPYSRTAVLRRNVSRDSVAAQLLNAVLDHPSRLVLLGVAGQEFLVRGDR